MTNKITNIKNRILAIDAAPAAIPPKPKIPAINAMIKKLMVHRNIAVQFKGETYYLYLK